MPKKEAERKDEDQKVDQKDGTKEEMTKKEAEKKDSQKDGTKEQLPKEKIEEIERKHGKQGTPTSKEPVKPTTKEKYKTMEEGMRKDEEQQKVQEKATAITTKEEAKATEEEEEEDEEIPDEDATEEDGEPEKEATHVGSMEGSKEGKKDGSDDKGEESEIGGRKGMKTSGEMHKMKDLGKKIYGGGKMVLGDGFCDSVIEQINNNRAIIATAIVAFSLGYYFSSKLRRSDS